MLALKKKREAEAKKSEEEGAAAPTAEAKKVSLLGVGGKKTKDASATGVKKRTPGELRIQKGLSCSERVSNECIVCVNATSHTPPPLDIAELDGGKVATIDFPNPNDLTNFLVTIQPDTGFWKGATYVFQFQVPEHYPHQPPKIQCQTKIYHPNIDLQGKVCLNILREDWKPVLDMNAVIYGLCYLFYEPNPNDPLNHEAAELFRKDAHQFERLVHRTLRGGYLDGEQFERLI